MRKLESVENLTFFANQLGRVGNTGNVELETPQVHTIGLSKNSHSDFFGPKFYLHVVCFFSFVTLAIEG